MPTKAHLLRALPTRLLAFCLLFELSNALVYKNGPNEGFKEIDAALRELNSLFRAPKKISNFQQSRLIVSIDVHPQYRSVNKHDNDMAILRFDQPVTLNECVQPICLPTRRDYLRAGRFCHVTGYGDTYGSSGDGSLKEALLPIVSHVDCSKHPLIGNLLTNNMICAGRPEGGEDSCQGDSGGPLVCERGTSGIFILHGLVSFGFGCARRNTPAVYAKVKNYIDWISSTKVKRALTGCGPLPPATNGRWVHSSKNGFKIGQIVQLECDNGYKHDDLLTFTTCLRNGSWTILPKCSSLTCRDSLLNLQASCARCYVIQDELQKTKQALVDSSSTIKELESRLSIAGKAEVSCRAEMVSNRARIKPSENACPAGWIHNEAVGKCYKLYGEKTDWFSASIRCSNFDQSHIVSLLEISQRSELDFLIDNNLLPVNVLRMASGKSERGISIGVWLNSIFSSPMPLKLAHVRQTKIDKFFWLNSDMREIEADLWHVKGGRGKPVGRNFCLASFIGRHGAEGRLNVAMCDWPLSFACQRKLR